MSTAKIAPEVLFGIYTSSAKELVTKLIWHYSSSGALQYQDEAHSEGQLALWQLCQRFDPTKQAFQVKKERERQAELLHSMIFCYDLPEERPVDPYANFWMLAVLRVRGGVLDFFRAQKLIVKRSMPEDIRQLTKEQLRDIKNRLSRKEDEKQIAADYGIKPKSLNDLKPTMFYRERFVSLDRNLSDFGNGSGSMNGDSFADVLPAPDISEEKEEQAHISYMITLAMQDAELNAEQMEVLRLYFGEGNPTKSQVARQMNVKQSYVSELLNDSICKLRQNWPEIIAVSA